MMLYKEVLLPRDEGRVLAVLGQVGAPAHLGGDLAGAKYCTPEINSSEVIVEFQRHFQTNRHCSMAFPKGLSLSQWIVTGIVQWMFSVVFQWIFTFVISGV